MGTAAKVWHRCRCAKIDGGAPMTQVDDLSRSLIAFEQNSTMVVVLEMSQSSWLAAGVVPGIERRPLKDPSSHSSIARFAATRQPDKVYDRDRGISSHGQCRRGIESISAVQPSPSFTIALEIPETSPMLFPMAAWNCLAQMRSTQHRFMARRLTTSLFPIAHCTQSMPCGTARQERMQSTSMER
jgi:hypothetical protein